MSEVEINEMRAAGENVADTVDGTAAATVATSPSERSPEPQTSEVPLASGVMSAAVSAPLPREQRVKHAAAEARQSGRRIDLLRYLRLRRRAR